MLVLLSANSLGVYSKQANVAEPVKVFSVSEKKASSEESKSISSINEFDGIIVKGNENTFSGFQNFQQTKKHLTTNLALRTTNFLSAFYSTYCHKRINSVHQNPFYISYHRLTI